MAPNYTSSQIFGEDSIRGNFAAYSQYFDLLDPPSGLPMSQAAIQLAQSIFPIIKLAKLFFAKLSRKPVKGKPVPLFTEMSSQQLYSLHKSSEEYGESMMDLVFHLEEADLHPHTSLSLIRDIQVLSTHFQSYVPLAALYIAPLSPDIDGVSAQIYFKTWFITGDYTLWKVRRALGDFLHFSAPQHVLLRLIHDSLLSHSVFLICSESSLFPLPLLFCLEVHSSSVSHTPVPYYFPRCHPLPPPRTPHVTPPTPVGPSTPPAARKQVSHRRFRLWSAPNPASAPRCSPLFVAPPQYALNPRSAVGRDPRCPPVPGFPAVSLSEPCAFGLLFSAFPRLEKLDFPLMHRSFPQPACVASAPRAFHISAVNIPRAPHKPGQSFGQGALPPPQR
ncbi:hypothetical protein PGT21_004878 [Puccinia graminis f. sp. tritici]|uniref:Uncharacterized protein n=1 Tax=Puccinia graminis f. sp. tritici TaxID=56615 RepID=A0A5B0NB42_PUCGR|nr:hypothetical protein PGT21_004878 [Puccinia graminis f. sp. tritici]